MGNRDIWDEIELAGTGEHLDEEMFEYLSAYADGECTAKERRLVEAYLTESPEAREQLADLRMQAAIASEGMSDPPDWLHTAIMSKTIDRPRLRWPFAAGITAAAAGAAALALYFAQPIESAESKADLIAANVVDEPMVSEPPSIVPDVRPTSPPAAGGQTSESTPVRMASRSLRRPERDIAQASRAVAEQPVASTQAPSPPVVEEPDPEVTYAVVEHRSGSFESKQPDVFDSEPSAEPARTGGTAAPAVLPDAREKLRDKVRKMNEEKLEIEGSAK